MVEWLEGYDCDRHGLSLKPTSAILLCPWERRFTALSSAWWSWQAVLNFSHIFIQILIGQQYLSISGSRSGQLLTLCISASF